MNRFDSAFAYARMSGLGGNHFNGELVCLQGVSVNESIKNALGSSIGYRSYLSIGFILLYPRNISP